MGAVAAACCGGASGLLPLPPSWNMGAVGITMQRCVLQPAVMALLAARIGAVGAAMRCCPLQPSVVARYACCSCQCHLCMPSLFASKSSHLCRLPSMAWCVEPHGQWSSKEFCGGVRVSMMALVSVQLVWDCAASAALSIVARGSQRHQCLLWLNQLVLILAPKMRL